MSITLWYQIFKPTLFKEAPGARLPRSTGCTLLLRVAKMACRPLLLEQADRLIVYGAAADAESQAHYAHGRVVRYVDAAGVEQYGSLKDGGWMMAPFEAADRHGSRTARVLRGANCKGPQSARTQVFSGEFSTQSIDPCFWNQRTAWPTTTQVR